MYGSSSTFFVYVVSVPFSSNLWMGQINLSKLPEEIFGSEMGSLLIKEPSCTRYTKGLKASKNLHLLWTNEERI